MRDQGCKMPKEQCDWKRITVCDAFGIRTTTWECRLCQAVRHRTETAPTLGDRYYRED